MKDWLIFIKNKEERINFAFTALCFSTLALSIQFSRGENDIYKWILIVCWILFLVSSILGGIRLFYSPIFDYLSYLKTRVQNTIDENKKIILNPTLVTSIKRGRIMNLDTGKPLNYEELKETTEKEEKNKKDFEEKEKNLNERLLCIHKFQVLTYLLAISGNTFFIIINYYN